MISLNCQASYPSPKFISRPRSSPPVPEVTRLVPKVSRAIPEVSRLVPEVSRVVPEVSRVVPEVPTPFATLRLSITTQHGRLKPSGVKIQTHRKSLLRRMYNAGRRDVRDQTFPKTIRCAQRHKRSGEIWTVVFYDRLIRIFIRLDTSRTSALGKPETNQVQTIRNHQFGLKRPFI